jgi:hypothetical protein
LDDEPRSKPKKKNSFPILISKIYLRLLFSIAIDRTEQITNMFYQFRIIEFLYKEVDLEFEISQIRTRFLQVRGMAKQKTIHDNDQKKVVSIKGRSPQENSRTKFDTESSANTIQGNSTGNANGPPGIGKLGLDLSGISKPKPPTGFKLNLGKLEKNRSVIEEESVSAINTTAPIPIPKLNLPPTRGGMGIGRAPVGGK